MGRAVAFFGMPLGERGVLTEASLFRTRPNHVHTYFIKYTAAEYATPKPDGNLTRLSPRVRESGPRDYSGDRLKKASYGAPESGWPLSDSSWQCYYMLGTTTKLSMPSFERLGLVTEINIKKVQKQDLKNIKNVKGCRDGMPKSMQTR